MKKLFKLLKAKTPKIGKKIRAAGLSLLGVAAVPEVTTLPDIPESWIQLLQIIVSLVGMFLVGAGQGSTESNPDEL